MTQIPVLTSEQLILRRLNVSDLDDYAAMMADAATRQFVGGAALNRYESWRDMCAVMGHWNLLGYGFFAVEEKASAKLIGRVGPHDPEGLPGVEIGWMIAHRFSGKGYATQAARLAIDWFFSTFDRCDSLISLIDKKNTASQIVAKKLGSAPTGRTFTHWQDGELDVWRLTRRAYAA